MARARTGTVIKRRRRTGTFYGIRYTAGDGTRPYRALGSEADGWTERRAREQLQNVLADQRRGMSAPEAPAPSPTFGSFAAERLARQRLEGGHHGNGLAEKSRKDLEWRLSYLLDHFKDIPLNAITAEEVDRFRTARRAEAREIEVAAAAGKPLSFTFTDGRGKAHERPRKPLSPASINKMISTLAAILEDAVEYELVERNVARDKKRKLKTAPPRRAYLDRASHISALLDAAGRFDHEAEVNRGQRRALLATLVFAGLRISETLDLRWGDVDLGRGVIEVHGTKTAASERAVNVLPVLHDELGAYRARLVDPHPEAFVFATATGGRQDESNVRRRVLGSAVKRANRRLRSEGEQPLPEGLTHHALRRTFASLLFALGEKPPYVMQQLGHSDPKVTLSLYARVMERRDGELERLRALVQGDVDAALEAVAS